MTDHLDFNKALADVADGIDSPTERNSFLKFVAAAVAGGEEQKYFIHLPDGVVIHDWVALDLKDELKPVVGTLLSSTAADGSRGRYYVSKFEEPTRTVHLDFAQ